MLFLKLHFIVNALYVLSVYKLLLLKLSSRSIYLQKLGTIVNLNSINDKHKVSCNQSDRNRTERLQSTIYRQLIVLHLNRFAKRKKRSPLMKCQRFFFYCTIIR